MSPGTVTKALLPAIVLLSLASGGCATVLSENSYPVTVQNPAAPTHFSVYDRKQKIIHQGVTPQQVTLDAKAMPFWPAKYSVVFSGTESTTQSQEVKAGFDPWFLGNFLIGGGIGAVVDGATGAVFKLPESVTGNVPAQFAVVDPHIGAQLAQAEVRSAAVEAEIVSQETNPVRTASSTGAPASPTLPNPWR